MPVATIRFIYFFYKKQKEIPETILATCRESVNFISQDLLDSLINRGYSDVRMSEKTNIGARTVSFVHEFFLKSTRSGEGSEYEKRLDNDLKAIQTGFEHSIMREKDTLLAQMEVDTHFEKISFDCTIDVRSSMDPVTEDAWVSKTRLDNEADAINDRARPVDEVDQIGGQLADIFKQAKKNNGS